jgi:hypothetical protein
MNLEQPLESLLRQQNIIPAHRRTRQDTLAWLRKVRGKRTGMSESIKRKKST